MTDLVKQSAALPELLAGDIFRNPTLFEHAQRVAAVLADGGFTPKHLIAKERQRTIANCLRVVVQAMIWGCDPFSLADESYEVHGRMGYQGKVIISVVNTRADLEAPLDFAFSGSGEQLTVTVSGQFQREKAPRTVTLSVAQAKTTNEMWKRDPQQKLCYSGAVKWARRYCPQLMLGIHTLEDLETVTIESNGAQTAEHFEQILAPPAAVEAVVPEPASIDEDGGEYDIRHVLAEIERATEQHEINSWYDEVCGPESDWKQIDQDAVGQARRVRMAQLAKIAGPKTQGQLLETSPNTGF